jgi:hypothetical protein
MQLKGLRSDPVIPESFSHFGLGIQLQRWDSFELYLRSVWTEESSSSWRSVPQERPVPRRQVEYPWPARAVSDLHRDTLPVSHPFRRVS